MRRNLSEISEFSRALAQEESPGSRRHRVYLRISDLCSSSELDFEAAVELYRLAETMRNDGSDLASSIFQCTAAHTGLMFGKRPGA